MADTATEFAIRVVFGSRSQTVFLMLGTLLERQREFEVQNSQDRFETSKSGLLWGGQREPAGSDSHRNIWRESRIRRGLRASPKRPAE